MEGSRLKGAVREEREFGRAREENGKTDKRAKGAAASQTGASAWLEPRAFRGERFREGKSAPYWRGLGEGEKPRVLSETCRVSLGGS